MDAGKALAAWYAHVYWMNKCMDETTGPGSYVQNVSTPGVASGALDPGLSRAYCSTASPQIPQPPLKSPRESFMCNAALAT